MNSKVKLRIKTLDKIVEYSFEHAQNIIKDDKYKDFECIDAKYKIVNNELIKQPKKKKETKPNDKD